MSSLAKVYDLLKNQQYNININMYKTNIPIAGRTINENYIRQFEVFFNIEALLLLPY
jgi:hypothetical protein